MPKTRYIRCRVSLGFFETEYYVMLESSSAYVDRSQVKVSNAMSQGAEVDGQVLASVLDESDREALIEISGEAAVGGLRSWIPKELFATA